MGGRNFADVFEVVAGAAVDRIGRAPSGKVDDAGRRALARERLGR